MTSLVRASRLDRTASVISCGPDITVAPPAISTDYRSILESAIEALHCKTRDARCDIYDEMRAAVDRHLNLMGLPDHIIERERLALDRAINRIEQKEFASQVARPHWSDIAEEFPEAETNETSVDYIEPEPLSIVQRNVERLHTSASQSATLLPRRLSLPVILAAVLTMLITCIAALSLGKEVLYGAQIAVRLPHLDTNSGEAEMAPAKEGGALPRAVPERPQIIPAIHVAGRDVEKLIASGRQLAAKSDFDNAISNFTEAIRLDPDLPEGYTERGQVFFKRNEFERAIADFTAALAVNDSYAPALRGRGMAQLYRGDSDRALDDLTKAIQLSESDSAQLSPLDLFNARRSRAALYGAKFQYDGQIADCTAIIQSYREDPAVREGLKKTYGVTENGVMAMIYRQRSAAYLQQANPEAALADLTAAMEFSTDRFAILLDRARVYEVLGARDQGLVDVDAALRSRPDNIDAKALRKRLSAAPKSPSSS